jgi:hypothetical protein
MSDRHRTPEERITGIELAEIEVLMLVKGVPAERLQRILDAKGVSDLNQLDRLTARNFLFHLRSL